MSEKKIPTKFTSCGGGVLSKPRADGKLVYYVRYSFHGNPVTEKVGLTEEAARERVKSRKDQRDNDPDWTPPNLKRRAARVVEKKAKQVEQVAKARTVLALLAIYRTECAPLKRDQDWQRWTSDAIERELGKLQLAELTPERIEQWRDKLTASKLSPSTIRKYIYFLSGIFTDTMATASGRRLLAGLPHENPCRLVKLPDEPKGLMKALTPEQASSILHAASSDPGGSTIYRWASLILHTGARVEEVQRLAWEDAELEWKDGELVSARFQIHLTKTGRPRFIEAAGGLLPDLAAWWTADADEGTDPAGPVIGESLKAFPYYRWKHTFERAGVPWGDSRGKFTTRNLRTTFCMLAFRGGARPEYLVQQTGHSVATLMRYYAVASRDQQKAAVNALPNLRRRGLKAAK